VVACRRFLRMREWQPYACFIVFYCYLVAIFQVYRVKIRLETEITLESVQVLFLRGEFSV